MASIAIHGPLDTDALAERAADELIGGRRDIEAAIDVLRARGLIAPARTDYASETVQHTYRLTREGEEALIMRLHRPGTHDEFGWFAYIAVDKPEAQALERAGAELLGTHEVSILYPGQGTRTWEVAFRIAAATVDDAMGEARLTMEALRAKAGVPQQAIVANLLRLDPQR